MGSELFARNLANFQALGARQCRSASAKAISDLGGIREQEIQKGYAVLLKIVAIVAFAAGLWIVTALVESGIISAFLGVGLGSFLGCLFYAGYARLVRK